MASLTTKDIQEFNLYLFNCTDKQVLAVYERERDAGRNAYAELALAAARKRALKP